MNDRQIKHFMDAIMYTGVRAEEVCDDTDALFAERASREAKPAEVGASSTAVDETQGETVADGITDDEVDRLASAWMATAVGSSVKPCCIGAIKAAIDLFRSRERGRFTADEVAALVTCGHMTHPDGSHHVWVAGEHAGAYDGHDDAQTAATEIRAAIRRTLEAKT